LAALDGLADHDERARDAGGVAVLAVLVERSLAGVLGDADDAQEHREQGPVLLEVGEGVAQAQAGALDRVGTSPWASNRVVTWSRPRSRIELKTSSLFLK
jgi:hypothetical protein